MKVLVIQSCPTLWDPMDCSQPGSTVHGILQARTGVSSHSFLQGIFLTPGIELGSSALQADSLPSEPPGKTLDIQVIQADCIAWLN